MSAQDMETNLVTFNLLKETSLASPPTNFPVALVAAISEALSSSGCTGLADQRETVKIAHITLLSTLVAPGLLGEPRGRHRLLMGHSGALWLATEQRSDREPQKRSLLEPPARLRKGSRCSESSILNFSMDLTLYPIWDQICSPKGRLKRYDARPGGTHGSIWALVGAQVLTLSATSGESCAKSGYSWPQT